jgi:hypothetical protein
LRHFSVSEGYCLPPRLSMEQMIKAFGATYRAIDIRAAAIKQGDVWANAYTVIRLTYEEPEEAESRLRQLETSHGAVRTNSFQVLLDHRPFSAWDQLCTELTADKVRVGGIQISFQQPIWVNLSRTLAYLYDDYTAIRPFDSRLWPVAQFPINAYGTPALATDTLVGETTNVGYPDPYEAVNLLCELNLHFNQSQGHQLYLSLPAFALVSAFSISPRRKQVHVEIIRHRALSSLKSAVLFRSPDHQRAKPWKHRLPVDPEISGDGSLVTAVGSITLPEVEEDDWAEAQILHPDIGELHKQSHVVRYLIPQAQRNILFEALKFFCSDAELRSLIVRPFENKVPKLKVSAGFELRIAWLLGLLGLSTVILGEYENIIAPETGVHRGSIDILAASQRGKALVLVACTIGPPKDEDFTNIVTMAEILDREVFSDASVHIVPLVCTCAPGYPSQNVNGVPVLDADGLDLALRLVKSGRERDVLSFVENPAFNELRDPDRSHL